jgi:S1-C subfamily serine protease
VQPGSQAERLGIRVGDVLLTYDGKDVVNTIQFNRLRRAQDQLKAPRELKVLRGKRTLTIAVSPGLLGVTMVDRAGVSSAPEP